MAEQAERLRQREALRASRRAEHEARRVANEAAREAHRQACLEGMRRTGQIPSNPSANESESEIDNADDLSSNGSVSDGEGSHDKPKSTKQKSRLGKRLNPITVVSKSVKGKLKVNLPVRGSSVTPKRTKVRIASVKKSKSLYSLFVCSDSQVVPQFS